MAITLEKIKLLCYHCGDTCSDTSIHIQEKVFCCNGCKTVYEILSENSLCDYYELDSKAGNKVAAESEYSFLEETDIQNNLLDFREGDTSRISFYIPTIHCSSCIWLLENLHKIKNGVLYSAVNFPQKKIDIQFKHSQISLKEIAVLLNSLGYAPEITLNGKTVNKKSVNKALYYKIGVAGFCFGNIMLLSIPEYVSFFNDYTESFRSFFSWLSLLLALPVFFYAASGYFVSAWSGIKNRMINIDFPIALGLVAAFSQSLYEIFTNTGTGYLDSLTGLIFFLLIGKWYQNKVYESLSFERDYKSYFPLAATLVKDGKTSHVAIHELKTGDVIQVRNHEVIPADAVLESEEAFIDYSFVTGESNPVLRKKGDRLFAGGKQSGEAIQLKISKPVSESYLTQLWNRDQTKKDVQAGLARFTNKVGVYFTFAVLLISGLTYAFWWNIDSSTGLYSAVSVLIIFCPCTLALAIPFCFANSMNILGKNGLFLKNTHTIEKLSDCRTIVWDKTGTLTYAGKADVEFKGELTVREKGWIRSLTGSSTHPLSQSIHEYWTIMNAEKPEGYREFISKGIEGSFNGHLVQLGSASYIGISPSNVIARVFVAIDGEVRGWFTVKNKYREGLNRVFKNLSGKYSLHLLSGDNDAEKKNLLSYFKEDQMNFFQTPTDKATYVKLLEQKETTLVIGDGLNDAGALMESHCGISVTEKNGTFSPACDAILSADQISRLPDFLAYTRTCVKIVRYSLLVSLSYNITGLFFACQGILKPMVAAILMPLSSISIVLFVLVLSNLYAVRYRLK